MRACVPLRVVLRSFLRLLVVIAIVGAACGEPGASPEPPDRPAAPVTPAPEPRPSRPPVLVADASGIRIVEGPADPVRFFERPATLAVPDLSGGVVFQDLTHDATDLHWDAALGRNAFGWHDGGPDPIWRITRPGHEPEVLISHPDARLTLVDVVVVDGSPHVLYRELIGAPASTDASWLIVLEWLMLFDLDDGDTQVLGLIGAYESSHTQMRIGGNLVAVTFDPYGDPPVTGVGSISLATLEAEVEDDWLPSLALGHVTLGPAAGCRFDTPCEGWASATAASDGSRLTWVQGGRQRSEGDTVEVWPIEVVTVDPVSSVETLRVNLGVASLPISEAGERPDFIDDDGAFIVVSGVDASRRVLLVTPEGEVEDLGLDGAVVSLWVERS